jgi:hypothetical protein
MFLLAASRSKAAAKHDQRHCDDIRKRREFSVRPHALAHFCSYLIGPRCSWLWRPQLVLPIAAQSGRGISANRRSIGVRNNFQQTPRWPTFAAITIPPIQQNREFFRRNRELFARNREKAPPQSARELTCRLRSGMSAFWHDAGVEQSPLLTQRRQVLAALWHKSEKSQRVKAIKGKAQRVARPSIALIAVGVSAVGAVMNTSSHAAQIGFDVIGPAD